MAENCLTPVFLKVLSFGQEHQNHLLEMQILGPTPELVNQSLGVDPTFVFLSSHSDSDELSSFQIIHCLWPSLISCYPITVTKEQ